MARNATMVRYKVTVYDDADGSSGTKKEIPNIISASGLSLGEEGTIEVPEWDRVTMIADGKFRVPELDMKYRLDGASDYATHKYFSEWWGERNGKNKAIAVSWTDRAYQVLFTWFFTSCEFVKFTGEDQELGSPKLGVIELKFLPYNVKLINNSSVVTGETIPGFPTNASGGQVTSTGTGLPT